VQARGCRGLLAGVMIGSLAAAGGCGSGGSGTQIEISKERQEIKTANRKKIMEQKKQEMEEKTKNRARGNMRGGQGPRPGS
jgi:hypothetical protein